MNSDLKKCDLVMKGGVTSGIVYPAAVCELAKEYRFVNIGGTSAGAIAAALTAAAEYRRQCGSDDGFRELAELPDWLAGGDGRRLISLFRPSPRTAPLFDAAVAYLSLRAPLWRKLLAALGVLARGFTRFASVALLPALVVLAVCLNAAVLADASRPLRLLAIAGGALALAAAIVSYVAGAVSEGLFVFWRVAKEQGFGLCSGGEEGALTGWLDARIRSAAGVSHPLTFAELEEHGVHLEMMTTSLTHGRPYRFPAETQRFLFAPSEMRRLFPADVVQTMIDAAPRRRKPQHTPAGEELHPLPAGSKLPVIVATRMSLSFPLLLESVPLWSHDFARRDRAPVPECCWFSDGGMTSNFPVHFFDRPLPRWPTFAFNLAPWTARYHRDDQNVYTPRTNLGGQQEWWTPIGDGAAFALAIKNTMQNWRDNMLLHLPGQRDRIAHVLLRGDEGGLNLTMDAETIRGVSAKGREAARALRARFADPPQPGVTLTWSNHKWVRFRSWMAAQEEAMAGMEDAWSDGTPAPSYEELLDPSFALPSYRVTGAQRLRMQRAARAFFAHIREDFGDAPFRTPARRPRPPLFLRAMPRE